jgi:hypothetical protein
MKNSFNGLASIVTSGWRKASDSALPAKRWFTPPKRIGFEGSPLAGDTR